MSGAAIASKVRQGLLKALGATGPAVSTVILRRGAPTGDAADPVPALETEYPCVAFKTKFTQSDLANTLIAKADEKYLVAADGLEIEPSTTDHMRIGTEKRRIAVVDAVAPAGVSVLWKVYLEGLA